MKIMRIVVDNSIINKMAYLETYLKKLRSKCQENFDAARSLVSHCARSAQSIACDNQVARQKSLKRVSLLRKLFESSSGSVVPVYADDKAVVLRCGDQFCIVRKDENFLITDTLLVLRKPTCLAYYQVDATGHGKHLYSTDKIVPQFQQVWSQHGPENQPMPSLRLNLVKAIGGSSYPIL